MSECENERYRAGKPRKLPPRFMTTDAAAMVGKVVSTGANVAVGKFLEVNPVSVLGAEVEGATGVTSANTSVRVPVYLVGPGLPATGDLLVCRSVDYRWVAERPGQTTSKNPCKCTWPRTLSFVGSVAQSQASFYFANRANQQPEPLYTLTWGPLPAGIPANLELLYYNVGQGGSGPFHVTMPANGWFSAPIAGTVFGIPTIIYFYMWVQNCQSYVMLIDSPYGIDPYAPTASGEPSRAKGAGDGIASYARASCTPFQLKSQTSSPVQIWGTHGSDDIVPDASGTAGNYTNFRTGP